MHDSRKLTLIIDVNAQGQVASIPRRLLDPRRPVGKPTSSDKEEMLVPYDAVLPLDTKRIISHKYPVSILSHFGCHAFRGKEVKGQIS